MLLPTPPQAVVIECLASGATGIWCAICDEGAATGHAGSLITLTNLARIGNKVGGSYMKLARGQVETGSGQAQILLHQVAHCRRFSGSLELHRPQGVTTLACLTNTLTTKSCLDLYPEANYYKNLICSDQPGPLSLTAPLQWAQSQVDLRRMREAAINITRVVTGSDPAPRTGGAGWGGMGWLAAKPLPGAG
jgi:hypothetical protein